MISYEHDKTLIVVVSSSFPDPPPLLEEGKGRSGIHQALFGGTLDVARRDCHGNTSFGHGNASTAVTHTCIA